MAAKRDVIPAPTVEQLCRLQLMRTTLVKFIEWRNFEDVVRGCFVRVLLEMRAEDRREAATGQDSYYIAVVKGAKKGPAYSGFSWDGLSTEWHIIIELPPCFKSSPNGNVVQLNSISNTVFKQQEYQQWVRMTKESGGSFITLSQIDLRVQVLNEHQAQTNVFPSQRRKRQTVEDPARQARRDEAIATMKKDMEEKVKKDYVILPLPDHLQTKKCEELVEIERQCLDLISGIRVALNERTKCRVCHKHVCTTVCYPCKHQVMCEICATRKTEGAEYAVVRCPAPDCNVLIQDRFEPFSS